MVEIVRPADDRSLWIILKVTQKRSRFFADIGAGHCVGHLGEHPSCCDEKTAILSAKLSNPIVMLISLAKQRDVEPGVRKNSVHYFFFGVP